MKLNLGDVEDRNFEDLPAGPYHVILTDGEVRKTSEDSKVPDNPFWNLEFTVQDGKHAGRKMWTNAMLPPYEPFTIKGLLKAAGYGEDVIEGNPDIELFPEDAEDDDTIVLLSEDEPIEVIAQWGKNRKTKQMEIRRFKPFDEETWSVDDEEDDLP